MFRRFESEIKNMVTICKLNTIIGYDLYEIMPCMLVVCGMAPYGFLLGVLEIVIRFINFAVL